MNDLLRLSGCVPDIGICNLIYSGDRCMRPSAEPGTIFLNISFIIKGLLLEACAYSKELCMSLVFYGNKIFIGSTNPLDSSLLHGILH